MTRRQRVLKSLSYIFLSISSLILIYPVLYLVLAAFTTNDRFYATLFLPIPNTLNLNLFARAFAAVQDAYLFTFVRVAFYLFVTLLTGLFGGYVFSKLRFPGRDKVFLLFLMGMVMPEILMIVPMFIQMAWVPFAGGNNWLGQGGHGFIGDWPVLFSYGWVPPLAIFLFKQNFDMLPTEYQEAARLDGAGTLTIIFRVYGPLLKPVFAALIIITFLRVWNDFLWPSLTIVGNPDFHPISYRIQWVRLVRGSAGGNIPALMAQFLMVMWPPAAVYFLLQRYFVQGLVASGLKG